MEGDTNSSVTEYFPNMYETMCLILLYKILTVIIATTIKSKEEKICLCAGFLIVAVIAL